MEMEWRGCWVEIFTFGQTKSLINGFIEKVTCEYGDLNERFHCFRELWLRDSTAIWWTQDLASMESRCPERLFPFVLDLHRNPFRCDYSQTIWCPLAGGKHDGIHLAGTVPLPENVPRIFARRH
ncbi:MAG: hypothetical protein WD200_04795 [Candidatus Andersenbacteria bacterium]